MNRINDVFFYTMKLFAITIILYCILFSIFKLSVIPLSLLLISLQLLLIFIYRKFKPLAIFFVFVIPYTLVANFHFIDNDFPLQLGSHFEFDTEKYYIKTFIILALFWASFSLILPKLNVPIVIKDFLKFSKQPIIFYFSFIIQVLILFFGRSGNSIFESGGYGSADSTVSNLGGTAIFEYFLIFYPLSYLFSGGNKFKINLLLILSLTFCLKAISFGGRVEAIQCMLLIFLLHFDNKTTKLSKIFLYLFVPILFFILFGFIRAVPNATMSELFLMIKDNINLAGYTFFGNQIEVFYSSTRLIGLIDIGVINSIDRIEIFFYNILAILTPYSTLPIKANLALYMQDEYSAGGGGLLPIFFYVYLSYFGVVMIGIILGLAIRNLINNIYRCSNYFLIYIAMLMSTYPRWYAYSSNVIYKFCFYSVILFFLTNTILYFFNKRNMYYDFRN